jgi:hypothetical protein
MEARRLVRRRGFHIFLDSRFTDGGEVSLTPPSPFTTRKIGGTHFCYRLSRSQVYSAAVRIRSVEKSSDLIGNRNRDLRLVA